MTTSTYYNRTFEANETIGQVMARNLIELLDQYDLRKKIITYVKDDHAFSKAYQYGIAKEKFVKT